MDQKGLAGLLAIKRSVGVAPMAKQRNPLHISDNSHKQGIDHGFETHNVYHHKPKQGTSGPIKQLQDIITNSMTIQDTRFHDSTT